MYGRSPCQRCRHADDRVKQLGRGLAIAACIGMIMLSNLEATPHHVGHTVNLAKLDNGATVCVHAYTRSRFVHQCVGWICCRELILFTIRLQCVVLVRAVAAC